MLLKNEVIGKSAELDFADIGFAIIEPFTSGKKILEERKEAMKGE